MKNIFKSKKENEKSDVNKPIDPEKSGKEMVFYGVIFCIILIVAVIMKFADTPKESTNANNNDKSGSNEKILEKNLLEELSENNYDADLTIIADTDLLNLLIRKESETKELISKTYRGENNIYYINASKIYKAVNNQFILEEKSNIYNNYDTTFINIENIHELINQHTYELDLKEEEYDIKRYKIEAKKVIEIYNEYNNADIIKRVSGEVILDIYYDKDNLKGLKLDLTNLYENLNFDYRKVIYTYEFDNFNKIDIDGFIEIPAE